MWWKILIVYFLFVAASVWLVHRAGRDFRDSEDAPRN